MTDDSYTSNADDDTLHRLESEGSNLSMPMVINFHVAVPNEAQAMAMADEARRLGYHARIYASPECPLPWTCECSTRMVASSANVIATQAELAQLASRFGGYPDGWGSFGNCAERPNAVE